MNWKLAIENRMTIKGLSKSDLARASGLSKSYITNILNDDESKRKKTLTFDSAEKIAGALGMRVWQLVKFAESFKG